MPAIASEVPVVGPRWNMRRTPEQRARSPTILGAGGYNVRVVEILKF